jgi:type IV fimbrial biogenesis protein FimT
MCRNPDHSDTIADMKYLAMRVRQRAAASRSSGFTIIELMVVLGIAAILIGLAVPQLTHYIALKSVNNQVSALASTLRLARSEAYNRNGTVTVCASANPEATAPTCSGSADWSTGWIVFRDFPPLRTRETRDPLIQVQPGFTNSAGIATTGANYTISFFSNGISVGNQGTTFTFTSSATGANRVTRQVCVSTLGSSRIC